jgi:hypothetical protein
MYHQLLNLVPQNRDPEYNILMELFPLNKLSTTPQDPYYHAEGDVWTHTKMVIDSLLTSNAYQNGSDEDKFILFYSALLHDISKPACTKTEDNGRISSAGHSKMGAVDTRIMLWKYDVPFHLRESVCNIIGSHQVPFFAFKSTNKDGSPGRSPEYLARQLSWQMPLHLLIEVAKADMKGRHCVEAQNCLYDIDVFEQLALEDNCLHNPKLFPDTITRMKYFSSLGSIASDYPFFDTLGSNVIVMCGLPASGKNEWIKNSGLDIPVLSFDDAKEELGIAQGKNPGAAVHLVIDRAKKLLAAKEDFIWNATHIATPMRQKTLGLLNDYKANIKIVYLEAPEKEIKRRNHLRDTTLSNDKIDEMLFRWDVPTALESHSIEYFPLHGVKPKANKIK